MRGGIQLTHLTCSFLSEVLDAIECFALLREMPCDLSDEMKDRKQRNEMKYNLKPGMLRGALNRQQAVNFQLSQFPLRSLFFTNSLIILNIINTSDTAVN